MSLSPTYETQHQIEMAAPPSAVFALLADATRWPLIFPPTVYVQRIERHASSERIRIWATANGEARGWTSRREFDHDRLRIRLHQEVPAHPLAAMDGLWIVEAGPAGGSRVRLMHRFRALDDKAETVTWLHQAVERNSQAELAALRTAAERGGAPHPLAFTDTVRVDGDAHDVYEFLYDAGRWEQRLEHVARVTVTEDVANLQLLEMDTRAADGSTHATTSVRVCFPDERIVYKQIRTPALMAVHTGAWDVRRDGDATVVRSTHTVVIEPQAVTGVLGPQADVRQAGAFVQTALSRNSMLTLHAAKRHAEGRRAAMRA